MKRALGVAVACSLLSGPALAQLAEYGIEGIWTVSTRDAELRGSVAPDGKRMVWGSDRAGGPGGRDLYRVAVGGEGDGQPEWLGAALNTDADEGSPLPSADGRWLLFASNGGHGQGGYDLKLARQSGGGFVLEGPVPGVN